MRIDDETRVRWAREEAELKARAEELMQLRQERRARAERRRARLRRLSFGLLGRG
jgi:hypothetical protein